MTFKYFGGRSGGSGGVGRGVFHEWKGNFVLQRKRVHMKSDREILTGSSCSLIFFWDERNRFSVRRRARRFSFAWRVVSKRLGSFV